MDSNVVSGIAFSAAKQDELVWFGLADRPACRRSFTALSEVGVERRYDFVQQYYRKQGRTDMTWVCLSTDQGAQAAKDTAKAALG